MVTLCEQALAVLLWTERRRLSNVARGAAEGLDGPGGRNGWMRPRGDIRCSGDPTGGV